MQDISEYDKAQQAAQYIKSKIENKATIAIVLGSGLGDFGEILENKQIIPYEDIPYFKKSSVQGHKGNLIFGQLKDIQLVVMQGRFHYYEGHSIQEVVFPIKVFKLLGITKLILTNASGGINKMLNPGDLLVIKDHINLFFDNPLSDQLDERFGISKSLNLKEIYNKQYIQIISETLKEMGIQPKVGVYIGAQGPNYETPAEGKWESYLGGDAIGASTVPEAIVARYMNMNVAGISCVSNMIAGITLGPVTHKEVLETGQRVKKTFTQLLINILPKINY